MQPVPTTCFPPMPLNPPADLALVAFDYDGVFTDGTIYLLPDGTEVRTAHIRDGYAVVRAVQAGIRIVVISGGKEAAVRTRLERLGVKEVYLGVENKLEVLDRLRCEAGLPWQAVGYCGDDVPDVAALRLAGWSACPPEAVQEVQAAVTERGTLPGGRGFVREVLESLMRARGIW